MSDDKNEAAKRLRAALPHLHIAVEMAKLEVPDGTVKLGIMAVKPSGGGKFTAQFEFEEFLKDIALLADYDPACDQDAEDTPRGSLH